MTVGRAPGVCSQKHMDNLAAYLDDERVVERWGVNVVGLEDWNAECARTRAAFGHDKAAAAGSSKNKSRTTLGYHLILAFNPDECAMKGNATKEQPISQAMAMEYAKEYITRFYPDQEAVITLHDEGGRWATHCFVNRTNLVTGNRYRASNREKFITAQRTRELDREWGLRELVPGKRNTMQIAQAGRRLSKKAKVEMKERGVALHSDSCRRKVLAALSGASSKAQFYKNCEELGVAYKFGKHKQLQFRDTEYKDEKGRGKPFTNGSNLGGGCSMEEIEAAIAQTRFSMQDTSEKPKSLATLIIENRTAESAQPDSEEAKSQVPEMSQSELLSIFENILGEKGEDNEESGRANDRRDDEPNGRTAEPIQRQPVEPDRRDAEQRVHGAQQGIAGLEEAINAERARLAPEPIAQDETAELQQLDEGIAGLEEDIRTEASNCKRLDDTAGKLRSGINILKERITSLRDRIRELPTLIQQAKEKLSTSQLEKIAFRKMMKERNEKPSGRHKSRVETRPER